MAKDANTFERAVTRHSIWAADSRDGVVGLRRV